MPRTILLLALLAPGAVAQTPAVEAKIGALLKQMTVEEKAGQMTQVTIDVVSGPGQGPKHRLDPARLAAAIHKYKVGSILNVNGEAYALDHWHAILNAIQDEVEKTRLKIPVIYGIDSVHGAGYVDGSELLPQAYALAAAWDPALVRRAGEITALEMRAAGVPWNFHPALDIGRNPVWPRFWEGYGEDVLITRRLGAAFIEGMQGADMSARDRVVACVKHYAGYSLPLNGRDRTPAWIGERMLRQIVLPPYEAGIRAGAPTVMANSGEINGIPGHANHYLLTKILKEEWGFKGLVVSDWEDIKRLHTRDRVAATPKEAVRLSVMAGVDMSMVPYDFSFYDLLLECVKDGSVPMSRIDDAVRRILRVKYMAGLFERPRPDPAAKRQFGRPEYRQANLEMARELITLLKNDGTLPLKKGAKILVTGPAADLMTVLNGGWSRTWQGDQERLGPKDRPTIHQAIAGLNGPANVRYEPGVIFDLAKKRSIWKQAPEVGGADTVVAALGEPPYCETPGNIGDLTIDAEQIRLVEELKKSGKPIVTVLAQGRPRVLRGIVRDSNAVVMAYLPGAEGGRALAEILFGEVNPSGKLPFTYPSTPNGFTTYDHKPLENARDNPVWWEWPFGHGLGYTDFAYSNLRLSSPSLPRDGTLRITVEVQNTGRRAGKEVVQLYTSDLYRSVSPPVKELKGFEKVALAPGETRTVAFTLTARDLEFVGLENKWTVEPGDFIARVGGLEARFTLQ
jgi:beta-glucosidase